MTVADLNPGHVIHCKNEAESEMLFNALFDIGFEEWGTGDPLIGGKKKLEIGESGIYYWLECSPFGEKWIAFSHHLYDSYRPFTLVEFDELLLNMPHVEQQSNESFMSMLEE